MYMPRKWNRCGRVKIVVMKYHVPLQAASNRQAHSERLKLFMLKISLSERGKSAGIVEKSAKIALQGKLKADRKYQRSLNKVSHYQYNLH